MIIIIIILYFLMLAAFQTRPLAAHDFIQLLTTA
jgi:hypothetical protein